MIKIRDILKDIKHMKLEDDIAEHGGISFNGETVADILVEFLDGEKLEGKTLNDLNSYLNQIGVKEIVNINGNYKMVGFVGRQVKELNKYERDYLESIISGYYNGGQKLQDGINKITIDFANGLSVIGNIIDSKDERVLKLEEDGLIYNPKI